MVTLSPTATDTTNEAAVVPPARFVGSWAMTTLLAWRNLAHDTVRLIATLIGVVFSVVLMGMQLGLLISFTQTTSGLIDHTRADLWLVPNGTLNVDLGGQLEEKRRFQALEVPGVVRAEPYLVGFSRWKKPKGGTESVQLIGFPLDGQLAGPWSLEEGSVSDLRRPGAVIVDRLYAPKLGVSHVGQLIEINDRRARVVGFTRGIRTFTQSPYVFTALPEARSYLRLKRTNVGYVLLKLAPTADPMRVKAAVQERIPDVDVYDTPGFSKSSSDYWLFTTGAGFSLIMSAVLGIIVGVVIVAQTLYASTIDRLPEYATLKAMGAPSSYLYRVIVTQAIIGAIGGYTLGIIIVWVITLLSQNASAAPVLPVTLALGLAILTLGMCVSAAVLSIRKVMAIDPVGVFR